MLKNNSVIQPPWGTHQLTDLEEKGRPVYVAFNKFAHYLFNIFWAVNSD